MPRPLIPVSEDRREARVTDMARVEVITIGAGGPAEARGETPGLRCRAGPEVSRPQVTAKTGGAGLHPTLEARGETSTLVLHPIFPIFSMSSWSLIGCWVGEIIPDLEHYFMLKG